MATVIEMPKLSDTMESGDILAWQKKEGDKLSAGDAIAEVQTDKAAMDLEVFEDGFLRKILVPAGTKAPVGKPIAILTAKADDDIADVLAKLNGGGAGSKAEPKAADKKAEAPASATASSSPAAPAAAAPAPSAPAPDSGGRLFASPLAARMAAEHGLDLRKISGSGPEGRVIKRDIEAAIASGSARAGAPAAAPMAAPAAKGAPSAMPAAKPVAYGEQAVSTMRGVIAKRLLESVNGIPHYYVSMDVDMDAAWDARERLKAAMPDAKISFNDMIIKASALALRRWPMVNSSWRGDKIAVHDRVDISVAVSIDDGLITPVVRDADRKGLLAISNEVRDLATRARSLKLKPNEYTNGTFTVSNLGMFGVSEFTAIINPPEAAILAVGGIRDEAVVKNGAVVPGRRMKLTVSSDHRLIDGALAAQFLKSIKDALENPLVLAM